ncbi:hypothetical protein ACI6Q2_00585 [Chitinophagaceae bacterium LWZ2-11]
MGKFIIQLPNKMYADVHQGLVIKKTFSFKHLFKKNKPKQEKQLGYIVKLELPFEGKNEYRLFRTNDNNWFKDVEHFSKIEEGEPAFTVAKAIEKYEQERAGK